MSMKTTHRIYATILTTIAATFFLRTTPLTADDDSAQSPASEKVWEPHDLNRPKPPVRDPGPASEKEFSTPPSDAVLLFNGKDLSEWVRRPGAKEQPPVIEPKWRIDDGYFEVVKNSGNIYTKEKFGDCRIHLEWATPAEFKPTAPVRFRNIWVQRITPKP